MPYIPIKLGIAKRDEHLRSIKPGPNCRLWVDQRLWTASWHIWCCDKDEKLATDVSEKVMLGLFKQRYRRSKGIDCSCEIARNTVQFVVFMLQGRRLGSGEERWVPEANGMNESFCWSVKKLEVLTSWPWPSGQWGKAQLLGLWYFTVRQDWKYAYQSWGWSSIDRVLV